MLTVGILAFDDVEVLDFAGPFEVFNVTGEVNEPAPFKVMTIGITGEVVKARGHLKIMPDYSIENAPETDILIVPGGWGTRALLTHEPLMQWLQSRAEQVQLLLSVCTGSLLLGKAGLLDGIESTTHHTAFDRLRQEAPNTTVRNDLRYVDAGKIVTSGGISAGIDMSLYVVQKLISAAEFKATLKEMEYAWSPDNEAIIL